MTSVVYKSENTSVNLFFSTSLSLVFKKEISQALYNHHTIIVCHFLSVSGDMKSSQWFLMLLQHSVSPQMAQ